jgi:hypothetical protein
MVQFIKQEAEEKANEIAVAAEEVRALALPRRTPRRAFQNGCGFACSRARAPLQEFNIEKLQLVEAEKAKIRKEYERKESQVEVKKKMCVARKARSVARVVRTRRAGHSAAAPRAPRRCRVPRRGRQHGWPCRRRQLRHARAGLALRLPARGARRASPRARTNDPARHGKFLTRLPSPPPSLPPAHAASTPRS